MTQEEINDMMLRIAIHDCMDAACVSRDPKRIPEMLAVLGQYWQANPDLRLGQIVAGLAPDDTFTVEDDELLKRLKRRMEG